MGFPPTTTKGSNDANKVTTFNWIFPFNLISHVGITATLGLMDILGLDPGASNPGDVITNVAGVPTWAPAGSGSSELLVANTNTGTFSNTSPIIYDNVTRNTLSRASYNNTNGITTILASIDVRVTFSGTSQARPIAILIQLNGVKEYVAQYSIAADAVTEGNTIIPGLVNGDTLQIVNEAAVGEALTADAAKNVFTLQVL